VRILLKALNPAICLWNHFKYFAHLERCQVAKGYIPYDFAKEDTPYF
jgi:hypothetical protein